MSRPQYRTPGYRAARAAVAARLGAGELVACHLCGGVIVGAFDLDHVRRAAGVLAPAHPGCNRGEGATYGNALRRAGRMAPGSGWSARRSPQRAPVVSRSGAKRDPAAIRVLSPSARIGRGVTTR